MASLRFECTRHSAASDVLRQVGPWVGLVLFLGGFGALFGERMIALPYGVFWVSGLEIAVVLGFLYFTFRRSWQPPPIFPLLLRDGQLTLLDPKERVLWQGGAHHHRKQTYVMRSRYGSFRFPVLVLFSEQGELRLCHWDPNHEFGGTQEGGAPHYLLGMPDWSRLLEAVGAQR